MQRPRVKLAHRPIRRADGSIWIGGLHHGIASEIQDETGLVWSVLHAMTGESMMDDIVEAVTASSGSDREEVASIVDFLIASGWVEDAGGSLPANLTARDLERYDRGIQLQSWVDQRRRSSRYELQSRLKDSRVAIIGLGGIGSAVAASLAASGVGRIHCVDGDRVELSNLNRQLVFTEADIGRPKAETGLARLRALNSDIEITAVEQELASPGELGTQVAGSDIFVLCADRPRGIEHWADQISRDLGIPWAVGSYGGPKILFGVFIPGRTACYGCMVAAHRVRMMRAGGSDLLDLQPIPGFNAVIAATAQICGHFLALEVISHLCGWPVQTAGGQLFLSATDYEHRHFFPAEPQPGCHNCGDLLSAQR